MGLNSFINDKTTNKYFIFILILLGFGMRYYFMTLGFNYDFESYCIVGICAGNFKNVYEITSRYNYGPTFFLLQGLLYFISMINQENWIYIYRFLIVTVLSITDFLISYYILKRFNLFKAILFFLNPVSIIITGYHNQFDNIAILIALYSVFFYNTEKNIVLKDYFFVLIISLSLITKHILFMFPLFILFRNELVLKKKIFYVFIPPLLFILSFVPFVINNVEAFHGILNNVFFYRSFNNSPLLNFFYSCINFPSNLKFPVYIIFMFIVAIITKNYSYEKQLLIYFISMVTFSSAIANQYLVIPLVALCVLSGNVYTFLYVVLTTLFLLLEKSGIGLLPDVLNRVPYFYSVVLKNFTENGYMILVWFLFFSLLYAVRDFSKGEKNEV